MNPEQQPPQQSQSKKPRCAQCNSKLTGVKFECKCKHSFCANHIGALSHACTFDYRAEGLQELKKQLDTTGLSDKIVKI
jgi:predicted nucleic acid binding AN1-type Zn finger protein